MQPKDRVFIHQTKSSSFHPSKSIGHGITEQNTCHHITFHCSSSFFLLLVLEAGLLGLPDARGSLFGVSFFMMAFLLFGVVSCASNWTVAKASSMTGPRITDCNGTGSLDPLPDSLVDELVLLDPLVFFAPEEDDACLSLFFAAALYTASFIGNCMTDGVATTMLVSVFALAAAAAAARSLFFGTPLHRTSICISLN